MPPNNTYSATPAKDQVRDDVYFSCVLLNCKRRCDVKTDTDFLDKNNNSTITYDKENDNILTIRAPSGEKRTYERIVAAIPSTNDSAKDQFLTPGMLKWGFKASAFVELNEEKKPTGKADLVFPGIWQPKDFIAAVATGSGLTNSPQVAQVEAFSDLLHKTLEEKDIVIESAHIVGHSLGTQNALAMHRRILTGDHATKLQGKAVTSTIIDGYGARVGLREEAANMAEHKAKEMLPDTARESIQATTISALQQTKSIGRQLLVQSMKGLQWMATKLPLPDSVPQKIGDLIPRENLKLRTAKLRGALNLVRNITSISANSFLKEYPDGLSSSRESSEEAIGQHAFRLVPANTPKGEEDRNLQKAELHNSSMIANEMYKSSKLVDQHRKDIPLSMQAKDTKQVINQEKGFLPALWGRIIQRTLSKGGENFVHQSKRTHTANDELLKQHEIELAGIDKALVAIDSTKKILRDTVMQNLGSYRKDAKPAPFVEALVDNAVHEEQNFVQKIIKQYPDGTTKENNRSLEILQEARDISTKENIKPSKAVADILEQQTKEQNTQLRRI
jgi:pimeloyl-ACP methyl ester carboxylesterase